MSYTLMMTSEEVSDFVAEVFPQAGQYGYTVLDLKPGEIRLGMETDNSHLRPGGTISGPTMFALADCAAYLVTLAHIGPVPLAVTTNLNINFLAKPTGKLVAVCKLLKLGKRLAVCDIAIHADADQTLVAHATATYSIPPR